MLTDESIQQTFNLAYSLHPNRVVAWEVTREALKLSRVANQAQDSRPSADRPYKQKLEAINLLRASLFAASEKWEKDQESRSPRLEPAYRPTAEDLLYRYLKTLVWHSMDRSSIYAAVSVGSLLFTYRTSDIAAISVDFFDSLNIRRVKSWFLRKVESRFRNVMLIPDDWSKLCADCPSKDQLEFVNKSLATLAPLVADHPNACSPSRPVLEEYFSFDSERSDCERVHVISNPECVGWARLVDEYNQCNCDERQRRLEDPTEKLRLPLFNGGFDSPGSGTDGAGGTPRTRKRFEPEPLNPVEVRSLRQRLDQLPVMNLKLVRGRAA